MAPPLPGSPPFPLFKRELKQRKRHPKIYLYLICFTSRLFQLAQRLKKWRTI